MDFNLNPMTAEKTKEWLKARGLKNPPLDSGISGGGDAPRQYASDCMALFSKEQNAALIAENKALASVLQELWPLATNTFGEMSIEEVNSDPYLSRLSDVIDSAKIIINHRSLNH